MSDEYTHGKRRMSVVSNRFKDSAWAVVKPRCTVCNSPEVTLEAGPANGPSEAYCDDHGPEWMGHEYDE